MGGIQSAIISTQKKRYFQGHIRALAILFPIKSIASLGGGMFICPRDKLSLRTQKWKWSIEGGFVLVFRHQQQIRQMTEGLAWQRGEFGSCAPLLFFLGFSLGSLANAGMPRPANRGMTIGEDVPKWFMLLCIRFAAPRFTPLIKWGLWKIS